MKSIVTSSEAYLLRERNATMIDVMTPEDFSCCHISGAINACIYEMVFLERVAECVPAPEAEVVLYDASGSTLAALTARDRMMKAGYRNVFVLEGGLEAWCAAGLPVETGAEELQDAALPEDGTYLVDTSTSRVEWIGRNLNNRHFGRIAISRGKLVISGGKPVSGEIVADMTTIENLDLQDPFWRDTLIRHLKSDDFFSVNEYPTASFVLGEWSPDGGGAPGTISGIVAGDLSIKEGVRPVTFPAVVVSQPDGILKAHAVFEIDRTLWRVFYGSPAFFERLGMHLVNELVTLELFVVLRPEGRNAAVQ